MKRIALVLGVVTAALALGAGPAHAQTYGEATTTTVAPGAIPEITVVRGEAVEVGGNRCAAGARVTVTWDDGRVLVTTQAAADGTFSVSVTVPENATVGRHLITATCKAATGIRAQSKVAVGSDGEAEVDADGFLRQYLYVNVLAKSSGASPAVQGGGSALPRTGTSRTATLVGLGAGALILGAAFVYGSRRERHAS